MSLFVAPRSGKQPVYVSDRLGVKRVMWRGGRGRQRIIFYCLARALPEMAKMLEGGTVYVKYNEYGVVDNFHSGETMMLFTDIKITEAWLNNISPLEYSDDAVIAHLVVGCLADWYLDGLFTLSTNLYAALDQR